MRSWQKLAFVVCSMVCAEMALYKTMFLVFHVVIMSKGIALIKCYEWTVKKWVAISRNKCFDEKDEISRCRAASDEWGLARGTRLTSSALHSASTATSTNQRHQSIAALSSQPGLTSSPEPARYWSTVELWNVAPVQHSRVSCTRRCLLRTSLTSVPYRSPTQPACRKDRQDLYEICTRGAGHQPY